MKCSKIFYGRAKTFYTEERSLFEFLYSLTERFDFVVGMEYLFGSEIKGETCFYEGFAKDYFSPSGQTDKNTFLDFVQISL